MICSSVSQCTGTRTSGYHVSFRDTLIFTTFISIQQSPVLQLSPCDMGLLRTNQVKYRVPVKRLLTTKQGLNLLDAVHL